MLRLAEAATNPACEARDHFLTESAYRKAVDTRKEQVQKILSLVDVRIGGDREWDITVNDDGFYSRVLRHGSLGLGESYVDGWWDCPALDRLSSRILKAKLGRNARRDWRLALQWVLTAFQSANETAGKVRGRKTL